MLHYGAGMTVAVSGQTLLLDLPYSAYPRRRPSLIALDRPGYGCHATFFSEDGHLLFAHMSEIVRAFAI
jgi:hypothetical protein